MQSTTICGVTSPLVMSSKLQVKALRQHCTTNMVATLGIYSAVCFIVIIDWAHCSMSGHPASFKKENII